MIHADPWDEVARLEDALEAELLLRTNRVGPSRQMFGNAEAPRRSPSLLRSRDPLLDGHHDLGWRYCGLTYRIDHV